MRYANPPTTRKVPRIKARARKMKFFLIDVPIDSAMELPYIQMTTTLTNSLLWRFGEHKQKRVHPSGSAVD